MPQKPATRKARCPYGWIHLENEGYARSMPFRVHDGFLDFYETQDHIVEVVLRTFSSVFPYVELWDAGAGDVVMLGAMEPWPTGPDHFRQSYRIDRVRIDMGMIDLRTPEQLIGRQLASQRTGFAIARPGPMQSDLFPLLEYAAPRAFFLSAGTRVLENYDERTRQQLLGPLEKRETLAKLPQPNAQLIFADFSTINGELYSCIFGTPASQNVPCAFKTPLPPTPPNASGTPLDFAAHAFAAGHLDLAHHFTTVALQQNPDDIMASYVSRVVERARNPANPLPRP